MTATVDVALLQTYSRGEITRREIESRTGQDLGFGTLLGLLHQHGLPLPRIKSDPESPGVALIAELAKHEARRVE